MPDSPATPSIGRQLPHRFALVAILIGLVLAIYYPTLGYDFVFDDLPNIVRNDGIQIDKLGSAELQQIGSSGYLKRRPLANLSFAINHAFSGLDPAAYRLTNIVIHAASGVILYVILLLTFRIASQRELTAVGARQHDMVAFVLVAIWLLHPVQTQSVTYVVQRMNSLASLFYLLALALFIAGRIKPVGGQRYAYWAGAVLSWLIGLTSKEHVIVWPLTLLLYEWCFFRVGDDRWERRVAKFLVISTVSATILMFIFFEPMAFLQQGYALREFTLGQRLLTESRVLIFYLSLLFMPQPGRMNLDHHFVASTAPWAPIATGLSLLLLAGLVVAAIRWRSRHRLLAFCIAWFFLHHVIESTIIALELAFEHRLYLPAIGVLWACTELAYRHLPRHNMLRGTIVLLLLSFAIYGTLQRNPVWASNVTLWEDCVQKSPNKARSHHNYAEFLFQQGEFTKALHHYREEVRLKPNYEMAHLGVAHTLRELGQFEEAAQAYELVLRHSPENDKARASYGKLLALQKKYRASAEQLKLALTHNPKSVSALNEMGNTLRHLGKLKLAQTYFDRALAIAPELVPALYNNGRTLLQLGHTDKAKSHLERAIALEPKHADSLNCMGNLMMQAGQLENAEQYYRQALNHNPKLLTAYNNLAAIMMHQNRTKEAVSQYRKALAIAPHYQHAKDNLRIALDKLASQGDANKRQP